MWKGKWIKKKKRKKVKLGWTTWTRFQSREKKSARYSNDGRWRRIKRECVSGCGFFSSLTASWLQFSKLDINLEWNMMMLCQNGCQRRFSPNTFGQLCEFNHQIIHFHCGFFDLSHTNKHTKLRSFASIANLRWFLGNPFSFWLWTRRSSSKTLFFLLLFLSLTQFLKYSTAIELQT